MTNTKLKATKRTIFGKKLKKIRSQHLIPANVYGSKIKSQAITLNEVDYFAAYKEAGETSILYITIEGDNKEKPTLISNIHKDPVSGKILHVDFRQVDLTKKVTASIDIELIGTSPAEEAGAVIVTHLDQIEIEALPTDLPEKFELSVDSLENINDSMSVSDIKYDKSKISILSEMDTIVAKAQEKQKEVVVEEVVEPDSETEEGEVEAEKTEEGDSADSKKEEVETKKEDKK
jgi:large subunit ribosomal protein L25